MYRLLLLFIIIYPYILNPFTLRQSFEKYYFLIFFVMILWLLTGLKLIKKELIFKYRDLRLISYYLIGLLILISLSTLFSVDHFSSFYGSRSRYEGFLSLTAYLSLFFFTYLYVPKNKVHLFMKAFSLNGIVIATYGILQHFGIDPITYATTTRSFAFFGNPNFFGSYITLALTVSIGLYLMSPTRKMSTLYFLSATLLFLALMYSGTRSGWLGSFMTYCFIFFILVFKYKQLWKKWIMISLSFFIIFVSLNYEQKEVTSRVEQTFEQVAGDVNKGGSGRIFIWKTILPYLDDRIVLGSGPDTFAYVFPNGTEEVAPYFNNITVDKAHNEYIQIAITLGFPALILYLLIIIELFHFNLKRIRLNPINHPHEWILLIAISGYLIQAFFNISVVAVAPYYWMILGLAYVKNNDIEQQDVAQFQTSDI